MMEFGLERFIVEPPAVIRQRRLGILANQASVDRKFRQSHLAIAKAFPGQVRALFSPQHGWFGVEQANMIESPHAFDADLQLPIFSLYSETRIPTAEMLREVDVLIADLQDVGTRIYTFIWTIVQCMRACKSAGIPVVVLDRPNPIGGTLVEGPILDMRFASFVGLSPIPMRHGLTIGELAKVCNDLLGIDAELEVVPLSEWKRSCTWTEQSHPWILPSPNLPRIEGVFTYPGMVLFEGTNLSEGRGTTLPFEVFGAPYLNGKPVVAELEKLSLPGVVFRQYRFRPTFDKWKGEVCEGAMLHVVDRLAFRPYQTAVGILAVARKLAPDEFAWLPPPYEYESIKMPIDILSGSSQLRTAIDDGKVRSGDDVASQAFVDESPWWDRVKPHLLYD